MFNPDFIKFSTSEIVNDLKTKGYFAFEEALTPQYVEELLQEINFNQILLNNNDVGVVTAQDIKFFTHCLAGSKKTYDVITSRQVLDVCKEYFSDDYKLTNHRVYQTSQNSHMPWHTDNNRQIGKQLSEKHNMPGLLFLFYLSDVEKNAFQYIKDSHKWSRKYSHEIYLSDSYIDKTYSKDILTFPMRKGSLILCDIHGIHRAEPFQDKTYNRTTLLFQVDQVGSENVGHGEKNIVNTEYLDNLTPEVMDYLGFGFKRDYPAFPNTSIATMKLQDILELQKQLLPKTVEALNKNILKSLLPAEAVINAKRLLWHFKSKYSKEKTKI
ncbi:MAG: phytanoyl-CoA dioxygenase family protein [Nostoc sp. DedVER02]|uniref:phytanoyl-CoA dioxygenase family protein n=1 Tax=unclassified Nostoc TaxID=2593658 RepID=UPI002AD2CDDC|nr:MULTISPECIES: phytanoyl-CoA dioxygenase family protein [unclassified Nostoc]MDZ7988006.1 phytanoyl-CoA dioxygenase family protein [Nostoc sp. DedVER02]MDZ8114931.1 phytanoyl-CoA dioxygenase family protein [Nostoc sp. DedVER01b]